MSRAMFCRRTEGLLYKCSDFHISQHDIYLYLAGIQWIYGTVCDCIGKRLIIRRFADSRFSGTGASPINIPQPCKTAGAP